jgi:Xaa-Pro aminopeptidase
VTGSPKACYGATVMTEQQMDAIQKLFDGETWTHMGIKSAEEVVKMKLAGAIGAHVLDEISQHVRPGVTLQEIDRLTHQLIVEKYGAEPACTP